MSDTVSLQKILGKNVLQCNGLFYNIIFYVTFTLLFIPKINLIAIKGQNAGFRIDDIILFICYFFLIPAYYLSKKKPNLPKSYGYSTFILWAFVGIIPAALSGYSPNILYGIRFVEYTAFLFFGYFLSQKKSIYPALKIYFNLTLVIVLLQAAGIIGGFTVDGYQNVAGRVVGLTAGPWELVLVINIIYLVIISSTIIKTSTVSFIYYTIAVFIIILLTGSRSGIIAFLFSVIPLFFTRYGNKKLILIFPGLLILFMSVFYFFGQNLVGRLNDLADYENLSFFFKSLNSAEPIGKFDYNWFDDVAYNNDSDLSWIIRATHWVIAITEFKSSISTIIFGTGIGTFGPALDGGIVRILVETGVIGLYIYLIFLKRIVKIIPFGLSVIFVYTINLLFIDIHLSYKSMSLFLFLIGYYQNQKYIKK
ncbi:MAG: hypothetical protein HGB36_05350 [Chlorobiaceae bacterium]|nr:hypothetical protein [Chlorobiaceae bacterium]